MEILDVVNKEGQPTGQTVERTVAHREGIMHRTSHVWLFRKRHDTIQVLLQKRSQNKDSYPGCYDISSAGHIPAGVDYLPSALRELEEELGIEVEADELILCGRRFIHYENVFHGHPFIDNQVSNVYLLWKDIEVSDLILQKEEIEEAVWMDFDTCLKAVAENSIPHCIVQEELDMLSAACSINR